MRCYGHCHWSLSLGHTGEGEGEDPTGEGEGEDPPGEGEWDDPLV